MAQQAVSFIGKSPDSVQDHSGFVGVHVIYRVIKAGLAALAPIGAHEMVSMDSSLKFCLVAEGKADLFPRLGPTSEWDTAAAQAVVEAYKKY
jgi:3'-phosphoadenosine 5'-phosphosulfate (PAPS) 3'-phosphatase